MIFSHPGSARLPLQRCPAMAVLFAPALLLSMAAICMGELRSWKYRAADGSQQDIFAEYVGVEGIDVHVKGEDGQTYRIAFADLQQADKDYVDSLCRLSESEFRTWRFTDGESLDARYATISERMVVFQLKSGSSAQIPWARLSQESQAAVVATQHAAGARTAGQALAQSQWRPVAEGITGVTLNPADAPDAHRRIQHVQFSPDARWLLVMQAGIIRNQWGNFTDGTVIWDVAQARKQSSLQADADIGLLNYTPDDRRTTLGADTTAWCFHPSGGEVWAWRPFHNLNPAYLARWNLTTGECIEQRTSGDSPWAASIRQAVGALRSVKAMEFSPDGRFVVLSPGDDDAHVDLWKKVDAILLDGRTFEQREALFGGRLEYESATRQVLISQDGNILAVEKRCGAHVWNLTTRQQRTLVDCGRLLELVGNGATLVTRRGSKVRAYDAATGNQLAEMACDNDDTRVAVAPVGRLIAVTWDNAIELREWPGGRSLATLPGHSSTISAIAFSRDGKLLATGDNRGQIKIWSLAGLFTDEAKTDEHESPSGQPPRMPQKAASHDVAVSRPTQKVSDRSDSDGWISIFDGRTLTGWQADQNAHVWSVVDGAICCLGRPSEKSHLYYTTDLGDFEFRAEVKINAKGNSGVFFRAKPYGSLPDGYECQIRGSNWSDTGSLRVAARERRAYPYDLFAVRNVLPGNEWFTLHITAKGNHITHRINGRVVVDGVDPDNSYRSGAIAIQHFEAQTVAFYKNIVIRSLR